MLTKQTVRCLVRPMEYRCDTERYAAPNSYKNTHNNMLGHTINKKVVDNVFTKYMWLKQIEKRESEENTKA